MASDTPFSGGELNKDYAGRWMDVGQLMLQGWSWSGRERDVVSMNRGGARFADVSAASGLDFAEDGRALAACDWDGDGRVDLFLRNRNSPGLRYLHGNTPARGVAGAVTETGDGNAFPLAAAHWVQFALHAVKGNRDAIGARLSVTAAGITHTRELRAGDGYLAQSSKVLHCGLGTATELERVTVRWRSGCVQEFGPLAADRIYDLTEGGAPQPRAARTLRSTTATIEQLVPADSTRMVLRTPLPLPPHLRPSNNMQLIQGTTALVLWDPNDAASAELLHALAVARVPLSEAGLNLALLCTAAAAPDAAPMRPPGDLFPTEAEGTWWTQADPRSLPTLRAVVQHQRGLAKEPEPLRVLLLDSAGRLQVASSGRVDPAALHADAMHYARIDDAAAPRAAFPGRWYYGHLPDLEGLAAAVRATGDNEATGFYVMLALEAKRHLKPR